MIDLLKPVWWLIAIIITLLIAVAWLTAIILSWLENRTLSKFGQFRQKNDDDFRR